MAGGTGGTRQLVYNGCLLVLGGNTSLNDGDKCFRGGYVRAHDIILLLDCAAHTSGEGRKSSRGHVNHILALHRSLNGVQLFGTSAKSNL